jgi:hypothetical protein
MDLPTVLSFETGAASSSLSADDIQKAVEKTVGLIVAKLRQSHSKFEDPHFGPTAKDELATSSLYGATGVPNSVGLSKYPSPDSLRWDRPLYDDDNLVQEEDAENEDDDEFGYSAGASDKDDDGVWCKNGKLFLDGSSSGDVVQGQLGDCWFLGALAVMGSREALIKECFWKGDSFKELGLFVLRFHKNGAVKYVIIDDRLPVVAKTGRLIFASCRGTYEQHTNLNPT